MPRRLDHSIARALRDEKVDAEELTALVKEAMTDDVLSAEERAGLTSLLAQHGDAFDPKPRRLAEAFLAGGTALSAGALPDPSLSWDTLGDVELRTRRGATLTVDGVHFDDVIQNQLGDCFLLASLSAIAAVNPKAIEDAITDHGDGTYSVRFFEKQPRGAATPVSITIDADLPARRNGALVYGQARDKAELWPSLLEKAYATWKGGYGELSLGGFAGDALLAITGKPADFYNPITTLEPRELWAAMQQAQAEGRPMVTGTGSAVGVEGTKTQNLVPMHIYSVIAVNEENGEKFVTLRNPYGQHEPGDDGVFKLTLREYRRCFEDLYFVQ